ncbi:MAG: transposase [Candidatus Dependentiae bacterium]|nr:transposase [Candidatus Dependentiae bacterium]
MSDQITQIFRKIFPTSHKRITHLLEILIPLVEKKLRKKRRHGKKAMSIKRLARRNPRHQNKSVVNAMFMTSGRGLALNLLIATGTTHDSKLMRPLHEASANILRGKPPATIHADKGFDAKAIRRFCLAHGSVLRIPYRKRRVQ